MIIIIPLGGTGTRFKQHHYKKPKGLINVFGKPILFWLIDSLQIIQNTIIYIPYNKEYVKYRLEDQIRKKYPSLHFKFYVLENNTRGAAETINIALKQLEIEDQPIISLDSDNFYLTNILDSWDTRQNAVVIFNDTTDKPIYSYVLKNENNIITNIVEKEKISDYACSGAYAFNSYHQLIKYTDKIIDNDIRQKDEFYTSTVINEMIQDDIIFNSILIPNETYICLGTPLQLKYFYNNFPKKSCLDWENKLPEMRICFDLDNTLVTFPKIANDYTSVEPITKNIEYLRYLKSFGHTIIIYTARRMKTYHGNVGKLMANIGKITFETLDKFNIPYDEIYFGKPQADIYIDDLGLNCYDDLEKELGFYIDTIKPRDFNQINSSMIEIFTKESNNLSGEIYYYLHIPYEIKDIYPIMIDYDINNKWYKIEQIDGLTASILYVDQLLTFNTLQSIMDSIVRIQSVKVENEIDINIYANYSSKIEERYNSYDYSSYPNHYQIFTTINNKLKQYQNNNQGKVSVIHGDTVLTNIMINQYGKIKLIDMRGQLGDTLTIYGDWLYDWGKLYQSLIGYDNILLDKEINIEYQNSNIDYFKNYFITRYTENDFNNVKIITSSLIFSLIPLHNNDKCNKFYKLLDSNHLH